MLRNRLLKRGKELICKRNLWFLAPFSWGYASLVYLRNFLYDASILKTVRAKPVVVSVGNIVAGGTGKTPFIHLLATNFRGRKVAILSRGYGQVPDEALMLAKKLPEVRVCIGKNRAELASHLHDVDLILLDDGFQHRKLYRDLDIVLLSDTKERYLPRGLLRDNPIRLRSADFTFQKGREMELKVKRIVDRNGEEISSIQGWKVGIFSGIAHPASFKKTVESLGAVVVSETVFADHEIADLSKVPRAKALICTEKDFVKLPDTTLPIYYLEMEMQIISGVEKWQKLIEKIDQKIDNRCTYE